MTPLQKLNSIAAHLRATFHERDEAVRALCLGIVTGYPVALISKPGTAKTAMVDELYRCFDGRAFSWLMTRYTTPDELAGPLSLPALTEGRYERVTDGRIVGASHVFLDECFKANSATLNAQLSILNERKFEGLDCPWFAWVGASNEYPAGIGDDDGDAGGDSLEALWDRYIIRCELTYMQDSDNLMAAAFGSPVAYTGPKLDLAELATLRAKCAAVEVPEEVQRAYIAMVMKLRADGIAISDRKVVKGATIIRGAALLRGRMKAVVSDLQQLSFALWDTPQARQKCQQECAKHEHMHVKASAELLRAAMDLNNRLGKATDMAQAASLLQQMNESRKQLEELAKDASTEDTEVTQAIAGALGKVSGWTKSGSQKVSKLIGITSR
jgi:MoxR-like ATPase